MHCNSYILLDFVGNFAVVPVAAFMGPKSTIHLFAIPIIVNNFSSISSI